MKNKVIEPMILINSGDNTPRLSVYSASDECILSHRNSIYETNHNTSCINPYRRLSTPDMRYPYQYQPPPPPMRHRFSLSLSQDDILSNDQLQQIHFDPRYRDCRSISNISLSSSSSKNRSNNSIHSVQHQFGEHHNRAIAQSKKWNTNPSIYIEEFVDETPIMEEKQSAGSASILGIDEVIQPLNEMSIKSINSTNEIPFIDDDGVFSRSEFVMQPEEQPPQNVNNENLCRKTVNFEILQSQNETCKNILRNKEFNEEFTGTNSLYFNNNNCQNYYVSNQFDSCILDDKTVINRSENPSTNLLKKSVNGGKNPSWNFNLKGCVGSLRSKFRCLILTVK